MRLLTEAEESKYQEIKTLTISVDWRHASNHVHERK